MKIYPDSLKNQYSFTTSMENVMIVDDFCKIHCIHFNQFMSLTCSITTALR